MSLLRLGMPLRPRLRVSRGVQLLKEEGELRGFGREALARKRLAMSEAAGGEVGVEVAR